MKIFNSHIFISDYKKYVFSALRSDLVEKELIEDQEHRRKKCQCVVTLFYPCCVSLSIHTLLGQNCSH